MIIEIHNPNNLPTMDYRQVEPLQGNLKDLSKTNYNKLKNVLDKRGFTTPLFVWLDREDSLKAYLVDGHQRQRVMLGEEVEPYQVPYVEIVADDILDAKAQLLEITSQYGTITMEGFDEFIADLPEAEIIEAVNFDALPLLGQHEEPDTKEDDPPELQDEAISQLGEVYKLGKHRLMVGDATNMAHVAQLTTGDLADMIFTDPPYNVDYTGKTKDELKIENDKKSDQEYIEFLTASFTNMAEVSKAGASVYVCHADSQGLPTRLAFNDAGFYLAQCLIWNKQTMVMGRQDYHWKHEPILYGWKQGSGHQYYGGRQQVTVWDIDRPMASREHPTMKPIALIAKAIKNNSKEDDIILDVFAGSGSTLIAAEQLNRTAYVMELDPRYADVIRKRYWRLVNNDDETGWEEATKSE